MAKHYESNKQGVCPKCGREITGWNGPIIDGNELYYYFTCDCGLAGNEVYVLQHRITSGDDATWEELAS